ncbi:SpvB/TcaC N-terminal domain-containing protein [Pelomonas sp. SE-A7]|uniref:SpvB/TcaC N-terminal domain-containing protein n=1 Tax=Pelomonas sp. SE-A7 TaxID=3054953 RepID=UPI00259D30AA|nr:SpvB/TcaC N-terminal domain-containing protein [Pelomonas sp. SE-A7]MDM4766662.1 SpvB/TcaC N-terminal domain-containing protein [Pelomonas sp. SE-A7]
MGERVEANPANGSCRLELPLHLPEGRVDLGTNLTLSYSSGGGDGPFGLGWSLSVPQVTRRTDRGVPTYGLGDHPDTFQLTGEDDLVPWEEVQADGSSSAHLTTFERWRIRRYRPRNERFAARVEHWSDMTIGRDPGHWRVTSRENVTYLYGFDGEARIADPADPSRVVTWLLQEVRDDRGNVAIYRYKAEDGAGVDPKAVHELQRWQQGRFVATAQRYLKRVLYANREPQGVDRGNRFNPLHWQIAEPRAEHWCYELVFDYGEHDEADPSPLELSTWKLRTDGVSSYRCGFEIRTLRQCHRALVFHRLPGKAAVGIEPAAQARLECVREHHFKYRSASPLDDAGLGFLESVDVLGIGRDSLGKTYREPDSALPPVRFDYSRVRDPVLLPAADVTGPLPRGMDSSWSRWIDLNGEGLPGLLWEGTSAWRFRANLSDGGSSGMTLASEPEVAKVEFAPPTQLPTVPQAARAGPGAYLLSDVDADGRLDLVATGDRDVGFCARDGGGNTWGDFHAFRQVPSSVRSDPRARWVDLTGDGLPDILITRADELVWLHSLGSEGYAAAVRRLEVPREPLGGPPAVFADGTETLFIADMSGDGLPDLVRIRNGSVVYWPSLGYGRFGLPVVMSDCPLLDHAQQFDPKRLRLADIDGSGTTDLLYLRADRIDVYANVAGNRWVSKPPLRLLPQWTPGASVEVVDLMGNGTACVVWSGPSSGGKPESLRVLDLTGGVKPHLLTVMDNGHGGRTTIDYTTSAREYLRDKLSGKPWHTRVPVPVQVVSRITRADDHAGTQRITRYQYHHGHYDGREREFRGFAFVEEWNAESAGAPGPKKPQDDQPPRLTKHWFHTGAQLPDDLARRLAADYWTDDTENRRLSLDPGTLRLIDTPTLTGVAPQDQLDAVRALAGRPLREEVYGLDGSADQGMPFIIREFSHGLRVLQARKGRQAAAVQVLEDQQLDCVIERGDATLLTKPSAERAPQQPRIQHTLALAHDALGFVGRRATVAYGHLRQAGTAQGRTWVTLEDRQFHHFDDLANQFRTGTPTAEQRQSVLAPLAWTGELWSADRLRHALADATRASPGTKPSETAANQIQLIEARYFEYWADSVGTEKPAPLGTASARALLRREIRLVFTADMLAATLGAQRLNGIDLSKEGGYVHSQTLQPKDPPPSLPPDAWWAPSPAVTYDRSRFLLAKEQRDPFGNTTSFAFDDHALHLAQVTDPYANKTVVETDYRALAPRLITDANLNRTAFRFDANARLLAMALLGKEGSDEGDSEESPTAEFSYQLRTPGQPMMARSREREQHRAADTRWRDIITYTDGSGREILRKMRAEPGLVSVRDQSDALVLDGQGRPSEAFAQERWVGSGRVVYNDKGNPVRQYEPYFATHSGFESDAAVRQWGVSPIMTYDAMDRLMRTDQPDGSRQQVAYLTWSQEHWDAGDLVTLSGWKPQDTQAQSNADDAKRLKRCADLSARYAATPELRLLDALGRVCEVNENDGRNFPRIARQTLDALGNVLAIQDADGLYLSTTRFDLLKRPMHDTSAAAGNTSVLHASDGTVMRRWTARGHRMRHVYDRLRRQTHHFVLDAAGDPPDATAPPLEPAPGTEAQDEPGGFFDFLSAMVSSVEVDDDGPAPRREGERLVHRVFHGESVSDPKTARKLNLMGKVRREFDGAGLQTFSYDFKGNRTETARRLRRVYRWQPDWKPLASETLDADSAPNQVLDELESTTYRIAQTYDALARVVQERHPDGTEVRPQYGDGGLLDAISARPRGQGGWQPVVLNIDYNARGQRMQVAWGNGVLSRYAYDPLRFRLRELKSWRKQGGEGRPLLHHRYFHDVAGNIVEITDESDPTHFYKGHTEPGGQLFEYDALYQLTRAEGRELPALPPDASDPLGSRLPHRADLQALARYTEDFGYDREGNLTALRHEWKGARPAVWTRAHSHEAGSNRLTRSVASGSPAVNYAYDAGGNLLSMPHLPQMRWDVEGRLASVDRAAGARVWMSYDAQGQRVRKVHRHGQRVEERIYLGPYEIYRRRRAGSATVRVERSTSHLMDGTQRVAMLETLTRDDGDAVSSPTPRWRYQLNDHLGSGCIELDETAKLISFEEFHAFGTTAVAAQGFGEVSGRRYRYTGKERDEETGLNYHGARYMAPWLARWISPDPAGRVDGVNVYAYVRNNPVRHVDRQGQWAEDLAIGLPSLVMGVYSLVDNVKQGNVKDAVIDTIGVVADAAAIALPGVPGGAGYAVKATRAVEVLQKVDKAAQAYSAAESAYKNGSEAVEKFSAGDTSSAVNSAGWSLLAVAGGLLSAKSKSQPTGPKALGVKDVKDDFAKARKSEYGSYTNTHQSGKKYAGKGSLDRAKVSAREKEKLYDDPIVSIDHTPAESQAQQSFDEALRIHEIGGKSSPSNYNKIETGKKIEPDLYAGFISLMKWDR